jgi:hypothetical protein
MLPARVQRRIKPHDGMRSRLPPPVALGIALVRLLKTGGYSPFDARSSILVNLSITTFQGTIE